MSESRALPPTQRDFEIYEAIHIAGCSTRSQAHRHEISQTRVRQIVRRVVEWLAEVLPPQAKVAREQETHLARQIAADRFQHQYQQMTTFWDMTRESKYAGLRMRITTAQARLGAVGGRLDGLAADAIEGIPVPDWQPPADQNPNPKSEIENPKFSKVGRGSPDPALPDQLPEDWDLFTADDLTPELVAACAAKGRPLGPNLIQHAQKFGRRWPRPDAENSTHKSSDPTPNRTPDPCPLTPDFSPPIEDCSTKIQSPNADTETLSENHDSSSSYDKTTDTESDPITPSQPLLTSSPPQPVTALRVTPNQPGISVTSPAPTPQEHQTDSTLPTTLHSS